MEADGHREVAPRGLASASFKWTSGEASDGGAGEPAPGHHRSSGASAGEPDAKTLYWDRPRRSEMKPRNAAKK